jgi:hypothetical protein
LSVPEPEASTQTCRPHLCYAAVISTCISTVPPAPPAARPLPAQVSYEVSYEVSQPHSSILIVSAPDPPLRLQVSARPRRLLPPPALLESLQRLEATRRPPPYNCSLHGLRTGTLCYWACYDFGSAYVWVGSLPTRSSTQTSPIIVMPSGRAHDNAGLVQGASMEIQTLLLPAGLPGLGVHLSQWRVKIGSGPLAPSSFHHHFAWHSTSSSFIVPAFLLVLQTLDIFFETSLLHLARVNANVGRVLDPRTGIFQVPPPHQSLGPFPKQHSRHREPNFSLRPISSTRGRHRDPMGSTHPFRRLR